MTTKKEKPQHLTKQHDAVKVAEMLGVSTWTVYDRSRRLGMHKKGEKGAKWSDRDVARIGRLKKERVVKAKVVKPSRVFDRDAVELANLATSRMAVEALPQIKKRMAEIERKLDVVLAQLGVDT